ncbi:hypothetical protein ACUOIJ_24585, partial [Escherichia coli]
SAARCLTILQSKNVVAHQLKIYVTVVAHSLTMASRTAFQNVTALNFVFSFESEALRQLFIGRVFSAPVHVVNFIAWAHKPFRLAMTFQTPFHLQRR